MGVSASGGTYSALSSLPDLHEPLDGACVPLDPLNPFRVFPLDPLEFAVNLPKLLGALCNVPMGPLSNAGEEVETILSLLGGCFDG